jgi:hypothetical protein
LREERRKEDMGEGGEGEGGRGTGDGVCGGRGRESRRGERERRGKRYGGRRGS